MGHMQRTLRIVDSPAAHCDQSSRVTESAQKITHRPVVDTVEPEEERVSPCRGPPAVRRFCPVSSAAVVTVRQCSQVIHVKRS